MMKSALPIKTQFKESFFKAESKELMVSSKTKRLWAVELDLLLEFDRVCREYGVRYSLDSGTLLGAVRHQGFIPWDDDVDVIMIRSEYEKLCKVGPVAFKSPYFFQTNETDPGCYRPHAQIRNSETTCILKSEMIDGHPKYRFNQGVFLDVFVADEVPNNDVCRKEFLDMLIAYRRQFWQARSVYDTFIAYKEKRVRIFKLLRVYLSFIIKNRSLWLRVNEKFNMYMVKVSSNNRGFSQCGPISLNPNRQLTAFYDVADFNDLTECLFEGYKFPIFRQYDKILKRLYGNWREHVIGGGMHGGLFVDVDKSYREYLS